MAVTPEDKDELKRLGRWDDFIAEREHLRSLGLTPAEAGKGALEAHLPDGVPAAVEPLPDPPPLEPIAVVPVSLGGDVFSELIARIPPVPPEIAEKEASEAANIRWIYNHIAPGTDLSDCPSSGAWLEVHVCRLSPAYMLEFLKGPRARLIPSKAQLVDPSDDGPIDGTPTIEFLCKIRAIGEGSVESVKASVEPIPVSVESIPPVDEWERCDRNHAVQYRSRVLTGSIGLEGPWTEWSSVSDDPGREAQNRQYEYRRRLWGAEA